MSAAPAAVEGPHPRACWDCPCTAGETPPRGSTSTTCPLSLPIGPRTGWSLGWLFGALSFPVGSAAFGLASPASAARPTTPRRVAVSRPPHGLIGAALTVGVVGVLEPAARGGLGGDRPWHGAGLYDPALSTLGRLYGEAARPAITKVTLYGGFASTVCWPLTAVLNEWLGWRGACLAYAAVHLAIVLPLYLFAIPKESW